jgi:hypothetical protein
MLFPIKIKKNSVVLSVGFTVKEEDYKKEYFSELETESTYYADKYYIGNIIDCWADNYHNSGFVFNNRTTIRYKLTFVGMLMSIILFISLIYNYFNLKKA